MTYTSAQAQKAIVQNSHFEWYILKCRDHGYYTGHTDNLENQLFQHQNKLISGCYTSKKLPVQCVYLQAVTTREEALMRVRQIKGWSRRKKEALIRGDWAAISEFSKR